MLASQLATAQSFCFIIMNPLNLLESIMHVKMTSLNFDFIFHQGIHFKFKRTER